MPPNLPELPPLALYLHFPWCVRKCPYCDFNSYPSSGVLPEDAYVTALLADLEQALPALGGRRPVSLFLGGGTPSLFSAATIGRLLEGIHCRLPWQDGAEITLEANPGTLDTADFSALRSAGITRLSLGIQSFDCASLKVLERIHSADEARRAADLASRNFESFNLDLMYGLPGQSLVQALADVDMALSFGPQHLSCYQLTLEPGTRFAAVPPQDMPDEALCADMQEAIESRLADAAYRHYETSAFAQAGQQCRHNLNYWQFGDYLGIGAGAHAKISIGHGIVRQVRWNHPQDYLRHGAAGTPVHEEHEIAPGDLPLEFMMNALRLNEGFPLGLFAQRTGLPSAQLEPGLRRAQAQGLLYLNGDRVVPSLLGRRFLNRMLHEWMPGVAEMAG
ncbi:MAG: Oxygen-independent coproporphyrinogen-III oxidase 1 [Betaproteobacteria bacterium ADurb.Bin341]|nr:MAG: Oxygen-independent coproporphyrinogen-III oxidase 1 [Betaproteobacteria bacterium ADurb.Bin341]